MIQKTKTALLFLICLTFLTSCGPRRYGCGPNRCEVKTQEQTTMPQTLEKSKTSLS